MVKDSVEGFDELRLAAQSIVNPQRLTAHAESGSVGAALQGTNGDIYTGVCIKTDCGMGFCAEHAAAAAMLTAGQSRVLRMVAVDDEGQVLPPCGRCREFISQLHDDNRDTEVLVNDRTVVVMRDLLPFDWRALVDSVATDTTNNGDATP